MISNRSTYATIKRPLPDIVEPLKPGVLDEKARKKVIDFEKMVAVGIDEAGKGALMGPLVIGTFVSRYH